jgi:phosphate acyltransferase
MQQIIGVHAGGADIPEDFFVEICEEIARKESFSLRCYYSKAKPPAIDSCACSDVITMDDSPLKAVRQKRDSTLIRAMDELRSGKISSLVTCAHTGAVTSAAVIRLGTFQGLHHPGLLTMLPTESVILDVGAFVTASADDLFHYLCLGCSFAQIVHGLQKPRVGLLNIGREPSKGTTELQQLDQWLLRHPSTSWTYVGNTEPRAVFANEADVIVTSGFVGNIFLKTAEGMATVLRHEFRSIGALLAGVRGIVIKNHGETSKEALKASIHQAAYYARMQLPRSLEEKYVSYAQEGARFASA